jgi:hypothetical protein
VAPPGWHLPVPRAHGRSRPLPVFGLAAGAGSAASWHRRIAGATDGTAPRGKHKPALHPGPPPKPERPRHRASSRGTQEAGCTCAWIGDHTPMRRSPWAARACTRPLGSAAPVGKLSGRSMSDKRCQAARILQRLRDSRDGGDTTIPLDRSMLLICHADKNLKRSHKTFLNQPKKTTR